MQNTVDLSISMVVAMTHERVIGYKNELPWGLIRSDRKHFAELTKQTGVIVMGRKTFESIISTNGRPLPDRLNIVATSRPAKAEVSFRRKMKGAKVETDVVFVSSIQEAMVLAGRHCEEHHVASEAFVIGGGEIYEKFLPFASRIYATIVNAVALGDTYFPELSAKEWQTFSETAMKYQCAGDPYETAYIEYKRITEPAELEQAG